MFFSIALLLINVLNVSTGYILPATTSAHKDFPKIKANPNFSIIGHMTQESEGMHLITRANTKIPLIARGWNSLNEES